MHNPINDPIQYIMDEIMNTTEAEEQKVESTTPCEQAEAQTEAIQETAAAENVNAEAETQPTNSEESPAKEPMPEPATKAEVIERLKQIVYDGGTVERNELEHLKMLYYRFHNADVVAARNKYIEEGGNEADFIPTPDADEENFKAQFALIREMRNKATEELEKQKAANLIRKQEIIERIKQLATSPEDADKGYDEVKQLQAEWKEIKQVPAENATELWKNYQLYVEQFYDQLRLNHEMRAYDFKKNLEMKTHLCEAAEKLVEVSDPVSAFHQLQKLHQEFREIGPVAKELREEIWHRFKEASTVINKRHQEHFEGLKLREEENLKKKTELCQKVEALDFEDLKTNSQWEQMTEQVLAMQAEWKTIGFTPRKVNAEIFERFRLACDRFFQSKTAYFKANREKLSANLTAKNALIEKAEALKDSTDWAATTSKLVELQKEWKTIGPVAHKVSDEVWKRFNSACNYFFEKKNEATSGKRKEEEDNLQHKKQVIDTLEKLLTEPSDNLLQSVRDLQAEWNEIGHVPYNKKEKIYRRYRAICDKLYDTIHETSGHRRLETYKRNLTDKGGTELTRERARLQNALDAKKQDITTYETNLSFFRTSSKSGNTLIAEVEKKIDRLKQDLQEITEKIKALDEQIKAED